MVSHIIPLRVQIIDLSVCRKYLCPYDISSKRIIESGQRTSLVKDLRAVITEKILTSVQMLLNKIKCLLVGLSETTI